jgi:hypothetical protein
MLFEAIDDNKDKTITKLELFNKIDTDQSFLRKYT